MSQASFDAITALGQSIWYDNIARGLIASGAIGKLIAAGEVRGITSNPTIFEKAIAQSRDYDAAIGAFVKGHPGATVQALYESLALDDIRAAADLLRPVYDASEGEDGYISLEVSPRLAHDTQGTSDEAQRLFAAIGRPNAMIKVPGTVEGLVAVSELIGKGINVNVTLLFSRADWRACAEAYLTGLERLAKTGKPLRSVASVASLFVSRVDTAIDKLLPAGSALLGKAAVAYGKLTYQEFRAFFATPRFQALAQQGARVQRLLWASTGTKNPAYDPLLYVDNLFGPDTVNTMPPATLDALRTAMAGIAGAPAVQARAQVLEDLDDAQEALDHLAKAGVDVEAVMTKLKQEGVAAFMTSFDTLLAALQTKMR